MKESVGTVSELVAGRPYPLKGQFAVDLAGGWRLVFAPAHDPTPTIVCIEYIGDYLD